jgi:hypothetical protein
MVDDCEENTRMKRKLSRNPHGLNFLPEFLRNNRKATDGSDSDIAVNDINRDNIGLLVDGTSTPNANSGSSSPRDDDTLSTSIGNRRYFSSIYILNL